MVKGNSRQVIVVSNPEQQLFEQAIFILKESAVEKGVTEAQLLQEAKKAAGEGNPRQKKKTLSGPAWAFGGALATGLVWLLTLL